MSNITIDLPTLENICSAKLLTTDEKHIIYTPQTDYAILCGAKVEHYTVDIDNDSNGIYDKVSVSDNYGNYWIKQNTNQFGRMMGEYIRENGYIAEIEKYSKTIGIRPTLTFSSLSLENITTFPNIKIKQFECGEYPKTIAPKYLQNILTEKQEKGELSLAPMEYTRNKFGLMYDKKSQSDNFDFELERIPVYEYEGEKYIRIKALLENDYGVLLNSRIFVNPNLLYWVKVEPIEWLILGNIVISKNIIMGGIPMHTTAIFDDYSDTTIHQYLNNFMLKEMLNIPDKSDIKTLVYKLEKITI